jgi:hypothetical protein
VKRLIRSLLRWLFFCRHQQTTWIFRDDAGLYSRCLGCGARVMPTVDLSPNSRVLVRIERTRQEVTQ